MSKTDEIAARLRDGLDGVTPGPWLASAIGVTSMMTNETVIDGCGVQRPADEQHIANCDPQSILAILDERDWLRAAQELAKEALDPWAAQADEIDKHLSEWPLTRPINIEGSFLPAFRRDFQKARRARAALEGKP